MIVQTWQIVTLILFCVSFSFALGYQYGKWAAWDKMDKEDDKQTITRPRGRSGTIPPQSITSDIPVKAEEMKIYQGGTCWACGEWGGDMIWWHAALQGDDHKMISNQRMSYLVHRGFSCSRLAEQKIDKLLDLDIIIHHG